MHLFGGKFCIKTDGSEQSCTCDDLIRMELEWEIIDQEKRKKKEENSNTLNLTTSNELPFPTLSPFPINQNQSLIKYPVNESGNRLINPTIGKHLTINQTIDLYESMRIRNHITIPECICDRKNFDNFLWATVTVFQVRNLLAL